ncbi:hypothetical protein INT43_004486 [Umbelopsis isabellina]|uniref:Ras modification protein ERF4 n=1 Tax=Mortierella isabellina TaxID=91625 RepID=A0A8H7PFW6_MORIS|nr:hypothetical protein INT43_004486 [Umbelopsis isabellina]
MEQVKRRHTDTFIRTVTRTPPPPAALRTRHSIQLPARILTKPNITTPDTLPLISLDDFLKSAPSTAESSIHHHPDFMTDLTTFIRVERDYSKGDGITKFVLDYPSELEGRITESQLRHTVTTINDILYNAERLSNNVFDNVMEIITIYLWPVVFSTNYQRCVKRLMQFIDDENANVYNKQGLTIANPVRNAFLFVSYYRLALHTINRLCT